jgi:hypothetical protein
LVSPSIVEMLSRPASVLAAQRRLARAENGVVQVHRGEAIGVGIVRAGVALVRRGEIGHAADRERRQRVRLQQGP